MSEPHEMIETALEDGPAVVDPETVLSDEQLRDGGLVPVRTWARTKASGNALRAKRSREKAEKGEGGPARKQVSVLAPPDDAARDALREVGKRMVAGEVSVEDVRAIFKPSAPPHAPDPASEQVRALGERAASLIAAGGLRGRLLRWLLGYRES